MHLEHFNPRKIKAVKREAVVVIEKYAGEGVSIAHENEKVIFVRYVIPGEKVRINIYKETKDYAVAEPLEILDASPDRIRPFCPHFALCGGCDYQMLPYAKQVEVKKQITAETFQRIGKMDIAGLLEEIRSPEPFHYRNTETFKVNPNKKLIGFFRKDTKFIVDLPECKLAMDGINTAMRSMREQPVFPRHNFKVRSTGEGDTVVHWVLSDHYQDRAVTETVRAAGKEIRFKISKDSFYQVNNSVIPLWLEKIISFLDPSGNEKVYDLYSGIGLITLFVSSFAKETLGIEIARSSVEDAEYNKKSNGIREGVEFIQAAVENKIRELGRADVIIIDPPRKGMEPEGLNVLLETRPEKIIYSSCKPATMARDIRLLSEAYGLESITLVDMFPQTHHVELLALLRLKPADRLRGNI